MHQVDAVDAGLQPEAYGPVNGSVDCLYKTQKLDGYEIDRQNKTIKFNRTFVQL